MSTWREVVPLRRPIDARFRPPGSKSETIRALFLAALAEGRSLLHHPLAAEDTEAARGALSTLGAGIETGEPTWTVEGTGGRLVPGTGPVDVGASGLTARSLIAVAALVEGTTTVVGRDRLPERPMGGVVEALRDLGVEVESGGGRLPVVVRGGGRIPGGVVEVNASETTQAVTAILLVAPMAESPLTVIPRGLVGSHGYVEMTVALMAEFGARVERVEGGYRVDPVGYRAAEVDIEVDASAAVYPMVAAAISRGRVTVEGLRPGSLQPDLDIATHLATMGCRVTWEESAVTVDAGETGIRGIDADLSSSPDGALALAVAAAFARGETRLRGLGSLRLKESDRLEALVEELRRIGAGAVVEGDDLVVRPGELVPARIETHHDHRMAMSFALAGLMIPGMTISDPGVVAKTWPGFWDFLTGLEGLTG